MSGAHLHHLAAEFSTAYQKTFLGEDQVATEQTHGKGRRGQK
jgi:hypothetical protein